MEGTDQTLKIQNPSTGLWHAEGAGFSAECMKEGSRLSRNRVDELLKTLGPDIGCVIDTAREGSTFCGCDKCEED